MKELRARQSKAIHDTRIAMGAGFKTIMLQAPTGMGKTVIAAHIISSALAKNKRVAFVVPKISLINQSLKAFQEEGILEMGVIQADHPGADGYAPVQICSVQSLSKRDIHPAMDLVIVDEAHINSKYIQEWIKMEPDMWFLGLSATPWTKGLGLHYKKLIIAGTTQELIDEGFLCEFRVFSRKAPDLTKIKTIAGDYSQKVLGERSDTSDLVADIVDTWVKLGEDRPTICFAVNRLHARHICDKFLAAGIQAEYMDAFTEISDREEIADRFKAGEVKIICNVGVLTTGIDWDVRCIIYARATKSEMLHCQMFGRGLRTNKDGADLICLDHSSTHGGSGKKPGLGFVTDIHHATLDMGEKTKSADEPPEKLPKPCLQCTFLFFGKICPNCGKERKPENKIFEEDGDLEELKRKKKEAKKKAKFTTEERQEVWAMLEWWKDHKGYSNGWVYHTCKAMTGASPKHKPPPTLPNERVMGFIRHMQIKYAKRKLKQPELLGT